MILPLRKDAPTMVYPTYQATSNEQRVTIGMRVSSNPVAITLVTAFKSPISPMSANFHGQPNPYSAEDIVMQFSNEEMQPNLVLNSGMLPHNPPSTVVNLSEEDRIYRKGAIHI